MSNGEYRTSQESQTKHISGNTFLPKPFTCAIIDGQAVFEGDMIFGPADQFESADQPQSASERASSILKGIGITGVGYRWPGGVIPFRIASNFPNQARVTNAIAHWQQNTFIRFVPRTNELNFVTFQPGNGCSSWVGMIGGEQAITLAAGCSTGNAIHEIGHAVGLWHEQSREDRNNFVQIVSSNIQPNALHNFNQQITDGDDIGPYDYGSIMHYDAFAFAIDPAKQTIISSKPIGQRKALSIGDILAVSTMYGVADPSGYILGNTQHVVFWGRDSHVHELWWNGSWHHHDLTNAINAPSCVSRPAGYILGNTQHVVYIGEDSHVHELWWDGAWHHNDLTNASGGVPNATGNAFGYILGNTQHVVYTGKDAHVHELWWNGSWHHNDLTNASGGAPDAVGNAFGYILGNTQHVVYTGKDAHVHELWWNGSWHHNDLTNASGASNINGASRCIEDPAGYILGNTQHVVYRGTDDHIHELWWDNKWHHHDLTNATGAPASASKPDGYILGNTQHVIYRGTNGHIHELWWNGSWHHNDLTNAAAAPNSTSSPEGYILGNTQHVVYRGIDNHIHELWWDGSWHHNDLTNAA
jgi:hypothetical protein